MQTRDATAAKNRFGEVLEACARAPVAIERHGRVVAYVVGLADFRATAQGTEDVLAGRLRAAGVVYATVFGTHRPCRSTVVSALARPEALVEIEAIAHRRLR